MYWGFGCCRGSLEKWKVSPMDGIPPLCKKRDLLYCSKVHVLVVSEANFQSGNYSCFSGMFIVLILTVNITRCRVFLLFADY